ncbi:hypothetical protein GQ54DRAFT_140145 [Martensiomyces pterosporus]|nr:hypothetical protein GQ54DRAFT_140145 [Martensiomyces pterosporus]
MGRVERNAASVSGEPEAPKVVKRKTAAEIRKANREKQRISREGSEETRNNAHAYLKLWSEDRLSWKFNKAKQLWVVRHLYVESQLPSAMFDIAVKYLGESKGVLRDNLIKEAKLVCEPMSATTAALQQLRTKVLGQMPSHVTKGEARSIKKAKAEAKIAMALSQTDGKESDEAAAEATTEPAEDRGDSSKSAVDGATPDGIVNRASRILEALTARAPSKTEDAKSEPESKSKSKKHKRKSSSDSGEPSKKKKHKHEKSAKLGKSKDSDRKEKKSKDSDKKEKKSKKSSK